MQVVGIQGFFTTLLGAAAGASGTSGAGDGIGSEALLAGKSAVNPDLHAVHSYVRTAPDGIPENNLSYHGEGKIQPSTNLDGVRAHLRTHADGIVENNLSYAGNSKSIPVITSGIGIEGVEKAAQKSPIENAANGALSGVLFSAKDTDLQKTGAEQVQKPKKKKNRKAAVLLSVFIPGAGQLYVGSVILGIIIFYAELMLGLEMSFISGQTEGRSLLPVLSLLFFVIYVFGILNASAKADEFDGAEESSEIR